MTFALSRVRAYGVEADEATSKKFMQMVRLDITAANTDVDLDLGDYSGTFWSAVDGSEPGDTALKVFQDIQIRAKQFLFAGGEALQALSMVNPAAQVGFILATATAGGGTTETLAVPGLPAGATILALQRVSGGNAVSVVAHGAVTADQVASVVYSADPGAGARIGVAYIGGASSSVAPAVGTYQLAMDGTNGHLPNITFASGSAPTAYSVYLWWDLKDNEYAINLDKTA